MLLNHFFRLSKYVETSQFLRLYDDHVPHNQEIFLDWGVNNLVEISAD